MRPIAPIRLAACRERYLAGRLRRRAARAFPSQPVRIIVPTQAGGMADILSRVFAQKVKERSGATVIVENKTGANGVLAADYVAKSAPNGLTVLIGFQGTQAVLPHLDPKLPYKPLTDFDPVVLDRRRALRAGGASVVPGQTVKEFVEIVNAEAGRLQLRLGGLGAAHHLAAELFKIAAGVDLRRRHLSRRRPRQPGRDRRPHPDRVRQSRQCDEQHPRRQRAGAGLITAEQRAPQIAEVPTMAEAGVA